MFCPRCRSEYRPGFTRCGLCQVDLVDELPPEDAFSSPEAMARVLADKELEALLVGSHVELKKAQGFFAGHRLASIIAGEPEKQQAEGGLHARFFLMVAAEDLERARALVQERWREGALAQGLLLGDATAPVEGTCPACGASVPAAASECPDCGLFLGDGGTEG